MPGVVGEARPVPWRDPAGVAGFAPSRWISAAEFAALRARPAMPKAAARFAASLIEAYSGNALLNMLLSDRGRVVVGLFVLYLDVLPLPGTHERGATLSAVQELCRRTGLCSAGRAASVLAAMRFGGYIRAMADPEDHRRRILVPAERLLGAHHRNWEQQFEAMATVFPDAKLIAGQLLRPVFRTAFLRELGSYFLAGFRVIDHAPVLAGHAESNAGLLILSSLSLRQLTGEGRAGEAVDVSISALSRKFRVSRAHVRNMLSSAEAAGLLRHDADAEGIVVLPALREALIQFFGVLFLLFHRCAAQALSEEQQLRPIPDPLN